MVITCPIPSKGGSTGFLPIHIKITNLEMSDQNSTFACTFIPLDLFLGFKMKGNTYKIAIDIISATTPPSLLGIDRRIAYIGKKYHSGWMCVGVTNGLAGIKFSGSIKIVG